MAKIILSIILLLSIVFPVKKEGYGAEIEPIPGIYLEQNQITPYPGVLFSERSLIALTNALLELRTRRKEVQTLEAQVEAMHGQSEEQKAVIGALEEAKTKTALALDKAEFMLSNFKTIESNYKEVIGIYRQALVDSQEARKGLQQDLQSARNEVFWTKVLGLIPIFGLLAAIIGGL